MKSFACKDAGVQCDWTTTGNSTEEIMSTVSSHAKDKHGIADMTPELINKVKGSIRNAQEDAKVSQGKSSAA